MNQVKCSRSRPNRNSNGRKGNRLRYLHVASALLFVFGLVLYLLDWFESDVLGATVELYDTGMNCMIFGGFVFLGLIVLRYMDDSDSLKN